MTEISKTTYILTLLIVAWYFIIKYKKRKYIISCFNLSLLVYLFSYAISPLFFNDIAWLSFGVLSASSFVEFLNYNIVLNGVGIIIMIISMTFSEFKVKYIHRNIINKLSSSVKDGILEIFYWLIIFFWYAIVLMYNRGLPLLNGGRTFYMNTSVSSIYLALNQIILLYSLFYGTQLIYCKRGALKWFVASITLLFSGNRADLLLNSLAPIMILAIYNKSLRKYMRKRKNKSGSKWKLIAQFKIFILIPFLIAIGIIILVVRQGGMFNIEDLRREFIYGNTFSDIRDGAYILKGYKGIFKSELLFGKTYVAGLLTFLPSKISAFKNTWLYGNFTTHYLFGWIGHNGLRGGNVLEAFLNFGFLGIVIFSFIQGWLLGYLERNFYHIFYLNEVRNEGKEYLILQSILGIEGYFVCTAGSFNALINIIWIVALIFISQKFNISFKRYKLRFK